METKKDALRGVRLGAPARAIACMLSIALAAGMVPSGAIAYAAEQGGGDATKDPGIGDVASGPADRVNEDAVLDMTAGTSSGDGGSEGAGSGDAASPGSSASASDMAAKEGAAKYTGSSSGQTSADVVLGGEVVVGTIESGGLAYTINADDPDAVAVTGIASTAPKGDVSIPSQVASGSELYKVTGIARGGGYHRLMPLMR